MYKGLDNGAYVLSAMVTGLGKTRRCAGTVLDGDGPELILVVREVGVTEIAHAVGIPGHAIDERVVIGTWLDVVALALGLADNRLGEKLERSGVVIRRVKNDVTRRPGGVDVLPGFDFASRGPDRFQLLDRQRFHEIVLGIDDQRDPVVADEESGPINTLLLGLGLFVWLGRTRGVDDIDLTLQITAKTAPGPVLVDDHRDIRIHASEPLLGGLADADHRARAVDNNRGRGFERFPVGPLTGPAARHEARDCRRE